MDNMKQTLTLHIIVWLWQQQNRTFDKECSAVS